METDMRIWRACRNSSWNELLVQALLGFRVDTRRTKDYSSFAARPLAELAIKTFNATTTVSLIQAVAPTVVTLTRLENAYASLKYEAPLRPYNMRAAMHSAFGGSQAPNTGAVL